MREPAQCETKASFFGSSTLNDFSESASTMMGSMLVFKVFSHKGQNKSIRLEFYLRVEDECQESHH